MAVNRTQYERIVFMQGDDAEEALRLLDEEGEEACLTYLRQWHFPGEHDTSDTRSAGRLDDTYEADGYILTYNSALNYVGLEYDTRDAATGGTDA